ncbi:MAG: Crp/Fnr family transcriptional regulator [Chloroflexi bacterium]|nr:Crp/Fnr family transcriptional regulator [Chloroflexota bacterium]
MRSQSSSDLASFLKCASLFADLDASALAVLARVCHRMMVPKGKFLFCQADCAQSAYIVYSGAISIILCTPDGRELVINEMRAGDCFGELALLTGGLRSASAMAREPSELIVIPRDEFLREVQSQPKLLRHLIDTMAARLRASTERESAFAFLDAPARLARILLQLDRAASASGYISNSQEEIAQRIGITRQTTAKILGQWRRKGWIVTGRGRIVVLDRVALRRQTEEYSSANHANPR